MSRTYVITVRLPKDLGFGLERYAARTGHKAAYLGALAVDEFMRRRNFPLIDFRETAAGRVAYVKGTRLAVYWLVAAIKRLRGDLSKVAQTWDVSPEKIRAALHYAESYPEEIKSLQERAEENRAALQKAEAALTRVKRLTPRHRNGKPRTGVRR